MWHGDVLCNSQWKIWTSFYHLQNAKIIYLQIYIFQVMNFKVQSWFYIMTKLVPLPWPSTTCHQRKWIKSKSKANLKLRPRLSVCDLLTLRCYITTLESPRECENTDLSLTTRASVGVGWSWESALLSSSWVVSMLSASAFRTTVLDKLPGELWHSLRIIKVKKQKMFILEILIFTELDLS